MVRLGLRSGEIVPSVFPPESIQANVEFFQRQVMLYACALDFVMRLEGMPKAAQMLVRQAGQMIFEEFGGSPGNSYAHGSNCAMTSDGVVAAGGTLDRTEPADRRRGRDARLRRPLRHPFAMCRHRVFANRPPLLGTWDYCSSIETWMDLLGRQRRCQRPG